MLTPKTKLKRKFNGKDYQFYDSYNTKREVQKEADKLRARGKLASITTPKDKLLPYYELWTRS